MSLADNVPVVRILADGSAAPDEMTAPGKLRRACNINVKPACACHYARLRLDRAKRLIGAGGGKIGAGAATAARYAARNSNIALPRGECFAVLQTLNSKRACIYVDLPTRKHRAR